MKYFATAVNALRVLAALVCLVAGTLVWMGDSTTKPIEQVKGGDMVLSKNDQTGEIAPKKVTDVSVRADIWMRKLSFDNGAVLETTDEHPLYIKGSGFVKAKEVGIGSSIVTRAGPAAKVFAVEADVRQATVYNFTVDDFHTYFVGESALWVHNADVCDEYDNLLSPFYNREKADADLLGVSPLTPNDKLELHVFTDQDMNPGGVFKWIISKDGEMKIVPSMGDEIKHSVAAGNQPVLAAGEMKLAFENGVWKVTEISNQSGHYQTPPNSMILGVDKLTQAGFDLNGVNVVKVTK